MRKGQSPLSVENYKGRRKGAFSPEHHELMPQVRAMYMEFWKPWDIAKELGIPYDKCCRWMAADPEIEAEKEKRKRATQEMAHEHVISALAATIPHLQAMGTKCTHPGAVAQIARTLLSVHEVFDKQAKEDAALNALHDRLDNLAELASSAPLGALEPAVLTVQPVESPEALTAQNDAADDDSEFD